MNSNKNFTRIGGQVTEVRIQGCRNDTEPCVIERGTTAKIEVSFITPFDTRSLYADVRGRTSQSRLAIYMPWVCHSDIKNSLR